MAGRQRPFVMPLLARRGGPVRGTVDDILTSRHLSTVLVYIPYLHRYVQVQAQGGTRAEDRAVCILYLSASATPLLQGRAPSTSSHRLVIDAGANKNLLHEYCNCILSFVRWFIHSFLLRPSLKLERIRWNFRAACRVVLRFLPIPAIRPILGFERWRGAG